jgi:hypothetical protein
MRIRDGGIKVVVHITRHVRLERVAGVGRLVCDIIDIFLLIVKTDFWNKDSSFALV